MPPSVSIPLAALFLFLFYLVLGAPACFAFAIGFYAGYLFYDIRGVKDPIDGSELYIRQVKTRAPQETENQELFAFQIALKKSYRSAQSQKP